MTNVLVIPALALALSGCVVAAKKKPASTSQDSQPSTSAPANAGTSGGSRPDDVKGR